MLIVTISGDRGDGKTTLARIIHERLEELGYELSINPEDGPNEATAIDGSYGGAQAHHLASQKGRHVHIVTKTHGYGEVVSAEVFDEVLSRVQGARAQLKKAIETADRAE
jgi:ABC-type multidrug transport system ATPase subunit